MRKQTTCVSGKSVKNDFMEHEHILSNRLQCGSNIECKINKYNLAVIVNL